MKHPSHILVIRLSAMGDVAMTVPVLKQLLESYPKLKITVLTKPFFVSFFEHLDRVQVVKAEVKTKHKGISGLWVLAKSLHRLEFDSIADLHNVLRSRILCGFLKVKGHDYYRIDKGRPEKKALTRVDNKIFKPLKSTHRRYAEVFKKLNLPLDKTFQIKKQRLVLSKAISSSKELDTTQKWIGIAPFAAHSPKQYPLKLMKQVIAKLNEKEVQVLLFGGGAKEKKRLESLAKDFKMCYSIAGKFSFPEELQLISNLEVMLSMDSGNGHLAAMFGVDVITLWGQHILMQGLLPMDKPKINNYYPIQKNIPCYQLLYMETKSKRL